MSRSYFIWTPDAGETEADAREVKSATRWGAVSDWCELEWSDSAGEAFRVNDGNSPTIVHVRDPEGNLTAVSVFAETDIVFRQYDEPLPAPVVASEPKAKSGRRDRSNGQFPGMQNPSPPGDPQ